MNVKMKKVINFWLLLLMLFWGGQCLGEQDRDHRCHVTVKRNQPDKV